MVPEWSTCSAFDEALPNFWFDPPLALQATDAVATPSLPGDKTMSTPASPSSTPIRPAPQTTFPPPVPVALPTAQSEVLPSSGPQASESRDPDTSTSPQTWVYTTPLPAAGLTSTAGGTVAQVPGSGKNDPGRPPSASASEVSGGNGLFSSSHNGDSDLSLAAQVSQTTSWNIADVLASILHLSKTLQSLQSPANTAEVILATLTETRSTPSHFTVEAGSSIDPVHTTVITLSAPTPVGSAQTYTTTLPVSGGDASVVIVADGTSVAVVGAVGNDDGYTTSQATTVAADTAATNSSTPTTPSGTGSGTSGSIASPPTSVSTDPTASTSNPATQTSSAYRSGRSAWESVMITCAALMYLVAASLR
ncbi:hypothetical protein LTR95_003897 [Oleoguttula sp. CCFEE 5521]